MSSFSGQSGFQSGSGESINTSRLSPALNVQVQSVRTLSSWPESTIVDSELCDASKSMNYNHKTGGPTKILCTPDIIRVQTELWTRESPLFSPLQEGNGGDKEGEGDKIGIEDSGSLPKDTQNCVPVVPDVIMVKEMIQHPDERPVDLILTNRHSNYNGRTRKNYVIVCLSATVGVLLIWFIVLLI